MRDYDASIYVYQVPWFSGIGVLGVWRIRWKALNP